MGQSVNLLGWFYFFFFFQHRELLRRATRLCGDHVNFKAFAVFSIPFLFINAGAFGGLWRARRPCSNELVLSDSYFILPFFYFFTRSTVTSPFFRFYHKRYPAHDFLLEVGGFSAKKALLADLIHNAGICDTRGT
jgi:hypothetical protein